MERKLKGFLMTLVIVAVCCGCGRMLAVEKAPALNGQYSLCAAIQTEANIYSAELTRISEGSWSIHILEPYELESVVIEFSGENIGITYGEASSSVSRDEWVQSDLYRVISAFEDAALPSEASVSETELTVTTSEYTLSFSRETKAPLQLVFGASSVIVEVTDFKQTETI